MASTYVIPRTGFGGSVIINEDGTGRTYAAPGGSVVLNTQTLISSPTGTFVVTETTDRPAIFGTIPPVGTLSATEASDTWSTTSGFDIFGIVDGATLGAGGGNYTSIGQDHIILLATATFGVFSFPTGVNVSSPHLTWHHHLEVAAGQDQNADNMLLDVWWAYSHNSLINEAITITGGGTTTDAVICAVKGMNGNFAYPFATDNPFAYGAAMGAFFGSQTNPAAMFPYACGPDGTQSTTPTTLGTPTGATVTGGGLIINSTVGNTPFNFAFAQRMDFKQQGLYYFEDQFNAIFGTDYAFGITSDADVDYSSAMFASGDKGAICKADGSIWTGSSVANLDVAASNGDYMACAVNVATGEVWFRNLTSGNHLWNGSASADPASGLGGISFGGSAEITREGAGVEFTIPVAIVGGTSTSAQQTLNFGATSFQGTVPHGFTSGWPVSTPTSIPTRSDYEHITLIWTSSVTNAGFGIVTGTPGFTIAASQANGGSQRDVSLSVQFQHAMQNVLVTDNNTLNQGISAPSWLMAYDTIVPGTTNPGYWVSTEAPDTLYVRGYPGGFGIVGDLNATENPDTAAIFGFERDSGVWLSRENTDTFAAYGSVPLIGVLAATEATDKMAATGLGLGEDGVWISTEGVDILTMFGHTPITAILRGTETPDRFVAIGAGVTVRNRRRQLIVA